MDTIRAGPRLTAAYPAEGLGGPFTRSKVLS